MSWFPLGGKGMTGDLLNNPIVIALAEKHKKSPAQIVLKWHTQMGFVVIPGSKNVDHIKDNISIYDFELDEEDMKEMSKLNHAQRRYIQDDEKLDAYQIWAPKYEAE